MAREAAQRLSRELMSAMDIWFRRNKKSATSNWRRESYGVQSLGPLSESRGGGGVLSGISFPSSSQICPTSSKVNVCVYLKKINIPSSFG